MPLADADAEQARQRVHLAHGVGVLALFAIQAMESSVLYRKWGLIWACSALNSVLRRLISSWRTVTISCWMRSTIWPKESESSRTSRVPPTGW